MLPHQHTAYNAYHQVQQQPLTYGSPMTAAGMYAQQMHQPHLNGFGLQF